MFHAYVFFFNDTATTEIYTLSLHDALPICGLKPAGNSFFQMKSRDSFAPIGPYLVTRDEIAGPQALPVRLLVNGEIKQDLDRKSTRLNSSHANISYAVFCLKKKTESPQTCR